MHLTNSVVKKMSYDGKGNSQRIFWDNLVQRFGVRVYPSNKKTFVIAYRNKFGTKRIMTVGKFGVMTLQQAREKARKLLAEADDGKDPIAEKQKAAKGATVSELCDVYIERHAKPHKKTWKEDLRRINRHVKPTWKRRKVLSVQRSDISAFHNKLGKASPYEANRVLELLRKMFDLASVWGFVPENTPNPAAKIHRFTEKKRDRWIKPEELPRVLEEIEKEPNIYVRSALWLYLFTGARKNEILKAKWEDLDFERQELHISDTKSGRSHIVPLSAPAMQIISSIPKLHGNPYLIPGAKPGSHFVNLQRAWERIRKRANLEDVRLHDLRRTVGSWLAMHGVSLLVIGKTLNHTTPSTTQIYARLSDDPTRKALEDHSRRIVAVAKGDSGDLLFLNKDGS